MSEFMRFTQSPFDIRKTRMSLSCDDAEVCVLTDAMEEEEEAELYFEDATKAYEDSNLLNDSRILPNILAKKESQKFDYFAKQSCLKPHMRRIVTDWMLEVCEAQRCHSEIFALAVDYMDRFLCKVSIRKEQFQLLASTCLFVASKFKEALAPLCADKLVVYADFAFQTSDIIEWELLLLEVLNWDLSVITSQCVLEQLLLRIPVEPAFDASLIRRHAETFLALATTELDFMLTESSQLAAAALMAAMQGMADVELQHQQVVRVREALQRLGVNQGVDKCVRLIESKLLERIPFFNNNNNNNNVNDKEYKVDKRFCPGHGYDGDKWSPPPAASTPTDLMDVSL